MLRDQIEDIEFRAWGFVSRKFVVGSRVIFGHVPYLFSCLGMLCRVRLFLRVFALQLVVGTSCFSAASLASTEFSNKSCKVEAAVFSSKYSNY